MPQRNLTKSRFKVGYECPTKLYYQDDKRFGNNNKDNRFLEALAEGGFQVGELAKLYIPGGVQIDDTDRNKAALETAELLKRENVVIYEATFLFENLLARADVLIKAGNRIELIEVKAKSIDPTDTPLFFTKPSVKKNKPQLSSNWEPYILDIAFQAFVFRKSFPQFTPNCFLMLADKTATASVDGLNQKFFLDKSVGNRVQVHVAPGTMKIDLGRQLLAKVPVDAEVEVAWNKKFQLDASFEEHVKRLSEICKNGIFSEPIVGPDCKTCEFRIPKEQIKESVESGFNKCWSHAEKLSQAELERPFVFDVWNFRRAAALLEDGKIFMDQIEEDDLEIKEGADGLSSSERQWLQITKEKEKDTTPYFDADGMLNEMKRWRYPLHFIDFETTMVAIPFTKNRRPYEQVAFQFSHHTVDRDGRIEHADEYINLEKGKFPNFDFVRALKRSLDKDDGTIFRFAAHENTVLCQILRQIKDSVEVIADREELISFIQSITCSPEKSEEEWLGPRNMVDLRELVMLFYFDPATKGSNSIKKVLPAILNSSEFLKKTYSKSTYGNDSLKSKNFKDWSWVQLDDSSRVIDPYKLLPPVFSDLDLETMDSLITEGSLADGGAAMTAYARMQFTQMSKLETNRVAAALLKYCELDTFAMVMIYQHWENELKQLKKG